MRPHDPERAECARTAAVQDGSQVFKDGTANVRSDRRVLINEPFRESRLVGVSHAGKGCPMPTSHVYSTDRCSRPTSLSIFSRALSLSR